MSKLRFHWAIKKTEMFCKDWCALLYENLSLLNGFFLISIVFIWRFFKVVKCSIGQSNALFFIAIWLSCLVSFEKSVIDMKYVLSSIGISKLLAIVKIPPQKSGRKVVWENALRILLCFTDSPGITIWRAIALDRDNAIKCNTYKSVVRKPYEWRRGRSTCILLFIVAFIATKWRQLQPYVCITAEIKYIVQPL